MAKKALREAIEARFNWAFSDATILKLNEDAESVDLPWVRIDFPVAENSQTSLGATYREDGSFRIVVATPILSGVAGSMELCESVAAVFRNQLFDNVDCAVPTIKEGIDEGAFFLASVIVPYVYYYAD